MHLSHFLWHCVLVSAGSRKQHFKLTWPISCLYKVLHKQHSLGQSPHVHRPSSLAWDLSLISNKHTSVLLSWANKLSQANVVIQWWVTTVHVGVHATVARVNDPAMWSLLCILYTLSSTCIIQVWHEVHKFLLSPIFQFLLLLTNSVATIVSRWLTFRKTLLQWNTSTVERSPQIRIHVRPTLIQCFKSGHSPE